MFLLCLDWEEVVRSAGEVESHFW